MELPVFKRLFTKISIIIIHNPRIDHPQTQHQMKLVSLSKSLELCSVTNSFTEQNLWAVALELGAEQCPTYFRVMLGWGSRLRSSWLVYLSFRGV
jgi:hypothetical protein